MEANITVFPLKWFEVKQTKRYKKQFNKKALNVTICSLVGCRIRYILIYVTIKRISYYKSCNHTKWLYIPYTQR